MSETAAMLSTVPGRLTIAPLVWPAAGGAESQRTRPFTYAELAERWHCDEATVRRRVNGRHFKAGREPLVRPGVLAQIEAQLEGRAGL